MLAALKKRSLSLSRACERTFLESFDGSAAIHNSRCVSSSKFTRLAEQASDFFLAHPVKIVRDLEHSLEETKPLWLRRLRRGDGNKLDHWAPSFGDHERLPSCNPLYQPRQVSFRLMNVDRRHG